jgi:hypothetical protein
MQRVSLVIGAGATEYFGAVTSNRYSNEGACRTDIIQSISTGLFPIGSGNQWRILGRGFGTLVNNRHC